MEKCDTNPLTPELQAELDTLAAMPESEIDTSEMPEITDWSGAVRGLQRPGVSASNGPSEWRKER